MNNFIKKLKSFNYKSKKAIICYIVATAVVISGGVSTYFLVDNYKTQQVLAQAEKEIQSKADEIMQKISKFDSNSVTLEDEQSLTSILMEYEQLDDKTKSKVSNFEIIKNCQDKIQTLKKEKEDNEKAQKEQQEAENKKQQEQANHIVNEINKIPKQISLSYENTVNILKEQYNSLSDEHKALVNNWNRISEIEEQLKQLKQSGVNNSSTTTPSNNNKPNSSSSTNKGNANSGSTNQKPQSQTQTNPQSKPQQSQPQTQQPQQPQQPQRTWEYMSSLSRQTFDLMNSFRQQHGVPALKWNETCNSRAKKQAEYNARTNTYGHGAGQISLGNGTANPQAYINQWAKSPDHKASMLRETDTDGAVAVYRDSNNNYYVVCDKTNDFWG